MALVAHYKLDSLTGEVGGNLTYENNSNALSLVSGRIGSAYRRSSLNLGADFLKSTVKIDLPGSFTMACWAYVTAAGPSANGLVTHHNHSTSAGSGITVRRISAEDYRISCNTGTGSSRTFDSYYGTSNIKDRWAHLVVRYDANTQELSLWVDGAREFTITYAMYVVPEHICIHSWSTAYNDSNNYRPAAYIDDVRVYNHALSAFEIYSFIANPSNLHRSIENLRNLYCQNSKVVRMTIGGETIYRSFSELRRKRLDSLSQMFSNTNGWVNDSSRGVYKNLYGNDSESLDAIGLPFRRIRRVDAKFTSYHDSPTGAMSRSLIVIVLDDDTSVTIGTKDSWTDGVRGQILYRPTDQGGNLVNTMISIVNLPIHYVVPDDRFVVDIRMESGGFSPGAIDYPFTERGISDIVLTEWVP